MRDIHSTYKQQWKKYCWVSKTNYDSKHKLEQDLDEVTKSKENTIKSKRTTKRNHQNKHVPIHKFQKGMSVLYYIGPHKGINGKWRQRWTGPWLISNRISESTVNICDKWGDSRNVSIDRIKQFKHRDKNDLIRWKEYTKLLETVSDNRIAAVDSDEDEDIDVELVALDSTKMLATKNNSK